MADLAVTQAEAADLLHVSRRSVQRARIVLEEGTPEVIKAVEQGKVPVSVAAKEIRGEPKRKPKAQRAQVDRSEEVEKLKAAVEEAEQQAKEAGDGYDVLEKQLAQRDRILNADDKLAAALQEIEKLQGQLDALRVQNGGLMNENVQLMKLVKYWKGKFERAEKSLEKQS